MKNKNRLNNLAAVSIVGLLFVSMLMHSVTATERAVEEEILHSLDEDFMQDIRQVLTGIILEQDENGDPVHWRGRAFGTSGEWRAAELLKEFWDQEIAIDGVIPEAEFDQLEGAAFTHKIDVETPEDYELVIHLENEDMVVPDTECFPVQTKITSAETFYGKNAIIHLAPDWAYGLGSIVSSEIINAVVNYNGDYESFGINDLKDIKGLEGFLKTLGYEGIDGELISIGGYNPINIEGVGDDESSGDKTIKKSGNPTENINHIYLIELNKCKDMLVYEVWGDWIFNGIATLLELFTDIDAFLLSDYNDDTHFIPTGTAVLPGMAINGSLGNKIRDNLTEEKQVEANFLINSYYFDDVVSKNVIGTIPGEVDDIAFIGAHYDSVWNQGACDDSGSISVVWGIAKYFADNDIKPYYTLKFAAWAGEEYGRLGSEHYVSKYKDEQTFMYCINAGAFGYINGSSIPKIDTPLHVYSVKTVDSELIQLMESIDYAEISGGYGGVDVLGLSNMVGATDAGSFIGNVEPTGNVFSFDKGWYHTAGHWYHRSGEGHTKGDVIQGVDITEINAAAFVVLTFVEYFVLNENDDSSGFGLKNTEPVSS